MKNKVSIKIIVLFIIFTIIIQCSNLSFAGQVSGLTDGYVYNITNKASNKCLNVNFGTDANGTNVTQFTKDGSLEQRFKLVYNSSRDSYKLYTMCSSNGTNRVLDILRTGGSASGSIASGCNVDIWTPNDNDAQDFKIINRGGGYYSLHPRVNTNLALTSYGTSNGSGAGTSSTSAGNVFISTYNGSNNQLWSFRATKATCYYYPNWIGDCTNIHNVTRDYTRNMGYTYESYSNANNANFLERLRNSEIFIYAGHGYSGQLSGKKDSDLDTIVFASSSINGAVSISSLAAGSLNNLKLFMTYSCYGGSTGANGNIPNIVKNKGAQVAVGWTTEVPIGVADNWNEYFFQKIYNEQESIVEGFRHADYWILNNVGLFHGQSACEIMSGHRYEAVQNDNAREQHLYK